MISPPPPVAAPAVFEPRQLDVKPVPLTQLHPGYPAELRGTGTGGTVVLEFVVDERGCVRHARVISSTNRSFEACALRAVSAWRFKPGMIRGAPVATHLVMPLKYSVR